MDDSCGPGIGLGRWCGIVVWAVNVADSQGAAMPGVKVTLTHQETNTTRVLIADGTGKNACATQRYTAR
jgi:hypothetical protein